jgi:hypothetical protein
MGWLAVLKSSVTWTLLAVVGLLYAGYKYGSSEYSRGYGDAQALQAKQVAVNNAELGKEIVIQQDDTKVKLAEELRIAQEAQKAAASRNAELIKTIVGLKNVKDTDCTRVAPATVRLLNDKACAYNIRRGFSQSATECPN